MEAFDRSMEALLELSSGCSLKGYSFGAKVDCWGEIAFNTCMTGYVECLSDPSYKNQILVCSMIHVGNYGVPELETDENNLLKYFESNTIHVLGLVITDYSHSEQHRQTVRSLSQWLTTHNVPAIFGQEIDTRSIAKHITGCSDSWGRITHTDRTGITACSVIKECFGAPLCSFVSVTHPIEFQSSRSIRVIVKDYGGKISLIRALLSRNVSVVLVPWNWDIRKEHQKYDGVILSSGPGNPIFLRDHMKDIEEIVQQENCVPILGICLGHQLLGQIAGAEVYRLPQGHRGHNHPVQELSTKASFMTSQNHGYAISPKGLEEDWIETFVNLHDGSNEGIAHKFKPIFSVQFHPEASGGPLDTTFVFDEFIERVIHASSYSNQLIPKTGISRDPKLSQFQKILILGSGGLQIGQAGEFDYSGSQAILALKQRSIETVVCNPNIATVQTSSTGLAHKTYLSPLTKKTVMKIIEKEKPEGMFISFGGQTALNLGLSILKDLKSEVKLLGSSVDTIKFTEDRFQFHEKLRQIGETTAFCTFVSSPYEAKVWCRTRNMFPLILQTDFSLGGLGGGFVHNETELIQRCTEILSFSPRVIIARDLSGWKEIEYEIIRDTFDNCIAVCALENIDPVGVHTGDSIVVAPTQTLTNGEYFTMRDTAIKIVRMLRIIGECNIQFALNPDNGDVVVIEVNARLSRSSALASKATSYPLAWISAQVALGYSLTSLFNPISRTTTAFFEPSLDYTVVKIPYWELNRFPYTAQTIGPSMKSVGEVMCVGRFFEEALQKCMRMVGLHWMDAATPSCTELKAPTWHRIRDIFLSLKLKRAFMDEIHRDTKINKWFLEKIQRLLDIERSIASISPSQEIDVSKLRLWKNMGFSDKHISALLGCTEMEIRNKRKQLGVLPCARVMDGTSGEFETKCNSFFLAYAQPDTTIAKLHGPIIVLGSGFYSIGSSVEFDFCCTEALIRLKQRGIPTICINCNPETVSTDYFNATRSYLEELSVEKILDIYEIEQAHGIILSFAGQRGNDFASDLAAAGCNILGSKDHIIGVTEDRAAFSNVVDELHLLQPNWMTVQNMAKSDVQAAIEQFQFPVIIRPSFVLSGSRMRAVYTQEELLQCLYSPAFSCVQGSTVVSQFIDKAIEVDFDGVSQDGEIIAYCIIEHIEFAGVHSGDATHVYPCISISCQQQKEIFIVASRLSKYLKFHGVFNIQFLVKESTIMVLECNARASRSLPFSIKSSNINFIDIAIGIMAGEAYLPINCGSKSMSSLYYVVKSPVFSFKRMEIPPMLDVMMSSTGEVACCGRTFHEAFLKSLIAAGIRIPKHGEKVVVVTHDSQNLERVLNMGFDAIILPTQPQEFDALIQSVQRREIRVLLNFSVRVVPNTTLFQLLRTASAANATILSESKLISHFLHAIKLLRANEYFLREEICLQNWNTC